MDTIELVFEESAEQEYTEIKFGKQKQIILVRPFMPWAEQVLLIKSYINRYLHPSEGTSIIDSNHDTLLPDLFLISEILKLYTNIKVTEGEYSLDIDSFLQSGLWEQIKSSIKNYPEFESNLQKALTDAKEQEIASRSMSASFDLLVNKVSGFVDTLSKFLETLNPENIEQMKAAGKELLSDIENSSVSQIFKEANMPNMETLEKTIPLPVPNPAPKTKRGRKKKTDLVQ